MKTRRGQSDSRLEPSSELVQLRARMVEAEETIRAIRSGEVDVVVVTRKQGLQMFTLEGAEHTYRVLIESMNEGALTLTADKTILYANRCFARMVKCPLEQVTGGSFRRFLSVEDRTRLRALMKRGDKSDAKIQVLLIAGDGSQIPVQISIRPQAKQGVNRACIGMVVTDMTEARRTEELLRALTHRVVQAQEAERGGLAVELHDNITQLLCAILFRSQALANNLSMVKGPSRNEAIKLRKMLGQAAEEVERISRNLRPGVLEELGLVPVLQATSAEFEDRTGIPVKLACIGLAARLPAGTELALYRIFQEALKNVEQHAHARHIAVNLKQQGAMIELSIHDDGIGFNTEDHSARRKAKGGLGLLGMRERAAYVGGTLSIKSIPRSGTKIEALIPLPPKSTAAKRKQK
ncbi:MAG: ATP-binding protein [Methylacidiphilales bacterium]|nr:ATP-binding protein [Candidatus Methylacidiphilales bacterium]